MGSPNLNLGDFYLLVCPYSFHPPLTPSPCTNRHSHTHIHTHRNTPESHTHTETQTETYTESYTRTHGNIHRVTHTHTLGHRVFRDCVACIHHSVLSAPSLQYYLIFFLQQPFINLKPSESLSTEVGKDGKLCVCVDAALPPAILTIIWACMMIPAMLETFKEVSPLRWCRMPGTG